MDLFKYGVPAAPREGVTLAPRAHRWQRLLAVTRQGHSHPSSLPPPGSIPQGCSHPARGLIKYHPALWLSGSRACCLRAGLCPPVDGMSREQRSLQSEQVMRASASWGFLQRASLKQTEELVSSGICAYRKQRSGCFLLFSEPRVWPLPGLSPPNKRKWVVQNWPHCCLN